MFWFSAFFSLKSECAGVFSGVSKEVFVLGWRWGAGYLWFTAICSESILRSLGKAYFPAVYSAFEPRALNRLPSCVRHVAFPQTTHHRIPINLCLAMTEDKQELQLLSAPHMLQVTKWSMNFSNLLVLDSFTTWEIPGCSFSKGCQNPSLTTELTF